MKKTLLILLYAVFITGCVVTPTPEQIAAADYGPYPTDYQERIKVFMNATLRDPLSAQYIFRPPYKGYLSQPFGGPVKYGWVVDVLVNAKNGFGGYTGAQHYQFLFSHGNFDLMDMPM